MQRNNSIGVLLDILGDLPENEIIERWCGENIKAVCFPTEIFIENNKGKPVLIKAHQDFFIKMIYLKCVFLIKEGVKSCEDLSKHRDFLCYLFHKQPKVYFNNIK